MDDARVVRQNCSAVLAMVITLLSSNTKHERQILDAPTLQDMHATPSSIASSARILTRKVVNARTKAAPSRCEAKASDSNLGRKAAIVDDQPPPPPTQKSAVRSSSHGASLALVDSASSPKIQVEARVKAALSSALLHRQENVGVSTKYIENLEQHPTSTNATTPLYDHMQTIARSGCPRGYLRTTSGGYRAPNEGLTHHRPSIFYLNDTKPPKDWADEQLGYQLNRIIVPNVHPFPIRNQYLGLAPRNRPATSATIFKEHRDITSFAAYAGAVGLDPTHPRAARLRTMFPNAGLPVPRRNDTLQFNLRPRTLPFVPKLQRPSCNATEPTQAYNSDVTMLSTPDGEVSAETDVPTATNASQDEWVETGGKKKNSEPEKHTLPVGPAALDVGLPLSPISPADVRRAVAWSPSVGARTPTNVKASGEVLKGDPRCDSTDNIALLIDSKRTDSGFIPSRTNSGLALSSASTHVPSIRGGIAMQNTSARRGLVTQDDNVLERILKERTATSWKQEVRAQRKMATSMIQRSAIEAKIEWRDALKQSVLNAPAKDDELMTRTLSANRTGQSAEEKLVESLQLDSDEIMFACASTLPIGMVTKLEPLAREYNSSLDGGHHLMLALSVRRRLQRILARWVEEFELSQLAVALGLWRINVWELKREKTWCEYRFEGAAARLSRFFQNRCYRIIVHAFARLASHTSWLIFIERAAATLKLQTAYRRMCAQRDFIARHDAQAINGAYADVSLATERDSTRVRFRIHSRVRLERRGLWSAATVIQNQQRRRMVLAYYQYVRMTATKLASVIRMWPLRRLYLLMRQCAITIEASIIMFLARQPYVRLCSATLTAQRVARGHAGRMHAYGMLLARRREIERRASAPQVIQQCWRGFLARQRVNGIHADIRQTHWAGLKLQFAWYRRKGSFATFVLLSCLRVSDEEDQEYAAHVRLCTRKMAARRISIYFRTRWSRVRTNAAVIIAASWRQFVATNEVLKLRKLRWAHRKLQHFVRARMKQRHASARRIVFFWWRSNPDGFRVHFQRFLEAIDAAEDEETHQIRDAAASTIQAIIHGQTTRRQLQQERVILAIQCRWRITRAHQEAMRRRYEKQSKFVRFLANRPIRDTVFNELNRYRRCLHKNAAEIQAAIRGFLTRHILQQTTIYAHSITSAAMALQRMARHHSRYAAALRQLDATRRKKISMFVYCETFDEVLRQISQCQEMPHSVQKPWLWYKVDDTWCGVGPHAVCRRSGNVEAIQALTHKTVSIHGLPSRRKVGRPSSSYKEVADTSLQNVRLIAQSIICSNATFDSQKRLSGIVLRNETMVNAKKHLDECAPLTTASGRHTAALLVCALCFAGLSQRLAETVSCPEDIESIVKLDKLPYPCRKLVHAFSQERLLADGDAPRDLSRGMMRQFCARYSDAEKALRALRSKEFARLPWVPCRSEIDLDYARVKHSYEVRRDALERLRLFLERRDRENFERSRMGTAIVAALGAADLAVDLAKTRAVCQTKAAFHPV